jgi:hypothetical protein
MAARDDLEDGVGVQGNVPLSVRRAIGAQICLKQRQWPRAVRAVVSVPVSGVGAGRPARRRRWQHFRQWRPHQQQLVQGSSAAADTTTSV